MYLESLAWQAFSALIFFDLPSKGSFSWRPPSRRVFKPKVMNGICLCKVVGKRSCFVVRYVVQWLPAHGYLNISNSFGANSDAECRVSAFFFVILFLTLNASRLDTPRLWKGVQRCCFAPNRVRMMRIRSLGSACRRTEIAFRLAYRPASAAMSCAPRWGSRQCVRCVRTICNQRANQLSLVVQRSVGCCFGHVRTWF